MRYVPLLLAIVLTTCVTCKDNKSATRSRTKHKTHTYKICGQAYPLTATYIECRKQTVDLQKLVQFEHLKRLDLSNPRVTTFTPLLNLSQIRELDLDTTTFSDLYLLRNMENLKGLSIQQTQVLDLGPLRYLTALRSLLISFSQARDFSPVAHLKNLRFIGIAHSPNLKHIRFLSKLRKLEYAMLADTGVSDLSPLRASRHTLRTIEIMDTKVSSLDQLRDFKNLERLFFSDTKIRDLSPLRHLHKLQRIHADRTPVSDITPLYRLKSLRLLSLGRTNVPRKQVELLRKLNPKLKIEHSPPRRLDW